MEVIYGKSVKYGSNPEKACCFRNENVVQHHTAAAGGKLLCFQEAPLHNRERQAQQYDSNRLRAEALNKEVEI